MDIFHALTMLGGLCLFLFGMNFMGQALERRAGGKLRTLLDKMTGSVGAGFLTGLGITAIIQSSSATTCMSEILQSSRARSCRPWTSSAGAARARTARLRPGHAPDCRARVPDCFLNKYGLQRS